MNHSARQSFRFFIYGLLVGAPLGIMLAPRLLIDSEQSRLSAGLSSAPAPGDPREQFNLDDLLVPRDEILHGGPAKDGIPALTNPRVEAVGDARWLNLDDRLIGVTINGQSRAYPMRLLNYHEIVNDELGSVPIAVIYCPLCDSASIVDRRVRGTVVEFGVSGLLHNSNVLMYDRASNGLWSQLGMNAISGPQFGSTLRHINSWQITSFENWRQQQSDSTVLTLATGHHRNYARNPYGDYCDTDELYFPIADEDDRLPRKARVVGVRFADRAIAYPVDVIAASPDGTLVTEIAGKRFAFACNEEATNVRVLEAPVDSSVVHTFWFAWASFNPQTELYSEVISSAGQLDDSVETIDGH
ncbi:MAG: DUF3179 domain-containing protein [Phycisphaerales bacterium]|nr:DUF3179 domain-containing protein [Phycisphaerales bacterium]